MLQKKKTNAISTNTDAPRQKFMEIY